MYFPGAMDTEIIDLVIAFEETSLVGASSMISIMTKIGIWKHRERTLTQNGKRSQQRLPIDDEAKACPAGGEEVSQ